MSLSGANLASRTEQVRDELKRVTDPELDESVIDLNFVTAIHVDAAGGVCIGFRLPTYWCAANFAFLMADDMRRAVASLPWVASVSVTLGEHMYAETINNGMAKSLSFQEAFGNESNGDLTEVRQIFAVKAFQRRQEALLRHLLALGQEPSEVLALSIAELAALPLSAEGQELVERYFARRGVIGPGKGVVDPASLAFVGVDGAEIKADALQTHLRTLRRVSVNTEFNGALCRGLLAARFDEDPPAQSDVKPIHFIRNSS